MNWGIVLTFNTMVNSQPTIMDLHQIQRGESPAAMSIVLCGMTTIVLYGAMLPAQVTVFTKFPVQKTQAPPSAILKKEMVAMLQVPTIGIILAPLRTMLRLIEENARIGLKLKIGNEDVNGENLGIE